MKKLIYKDKHKRQTVLNFENKKNILSSIFKNNSLSVFIRWNALNHLSMSSKNVNKIRLNQRCIITGRNSKFNKRFKFSRLKFLQLARKGFISGIRNSTW